MDIDSFSGPSAEPQINLPPKPYSENMWTCVSANPEIPVLCHRTNGLGIRTAHPEAIASASDVYQNVPQTPDVIVTLLLHSIVTARSRFVRLRFRIRPDSTGT